MTGYEKSVREALQALVTSEDDSGRAARASKALKELDSEDLASRMREGQSVEECVKALMGDE